MKVKVAEIILDYDGTQLKENEVKINRETLTNLENLVKNGRTSFQILEDIKREAEKKPLNYRSVINYALNTPAQEGNGFENMSINDKALCYEITKKIFSSEEVELTNDEIKLIISRVDKIYIAPIICGRIKEFLKYNTIH